MARTAGALRTFSRTMPRLHRTIPSLLIAFAGAAAPTPSAAQSILGLVRGPAARTALTLFADPADHPVWQRATPIRPKRSTTDARGRFRVATTASAGLILAEQPGVGAALVRVRAGVPVGIRLQPIGTVTIADGARFRAWIRAFAPDSNDASIAIGAREGTAVQLPAGRYSVLIECDGRRAEHRCTVPPGGTVTLDPPPPRDALPRIRPRPGAGAFALARWPTATLSAEPDGTIPLPASQTLGRVLETFALAEGSASIEHHYDGRSTRPRVIGGRDPSWERITLTDSASGAAIANAAVVALDATGSSVRSRWISDADGHAQYARPRGKAAGWIVVKAPGAAPWVVETPMRSAQCVVDLRPSVRLRVRVETADPVGDAPALVTVDQPPYGTLARRARTDARGMATFTELAAGPARITVDQPSHLPGSEVIEVAADVPPLVIELREGLSLAGRVRLENGHPARGVAVELRDASGRSNGPRARITATDASGRFRFAGLANGAFTLFVSSEVDGVTWSARRSGVTAGGDDVELRLRCEDPPLPGGDR